MARMDRAQEGDGEDGDVRRELYGRSVSRRRVLQLAGMGAAGAVLAACGGGKSSSSAKNGSGSGSGTTGPTVGSAPSSADMVSFIRTTFKGGSPTSGAGMAFPFAAGLLLSTSQAPYGQDSLKGIKLAVAQIKAAGGPDFSPNIKDFAASTTAGATAMKAWGQSHTPWCTSCGFFDEGNIIAPAEQFQVLTTDPGGGDLPVFQGKPYIWGTRAVTPLDAYGGVAQYLAKTSPKSTRIVMAGADLGPLKSQFVDAYKKAFAQYFPAAKLVGQEYTVASSSGTYDFTPAVAKIANLNPDVILPLVWGTDPASFMKAYVTAGLTAKVIGPDYYASSANLAGSAIKGYMFAYDYFDAANPGNEWGKMFAAEYEATYGVAPGYYPANYYENTFFLWQLIQRTLERKGNPKSGTDLQAALMEDTTLMSVYGTGSSTGSITLSPTTHTPTSRPQGLFEVTSTSSKAQPKQLASFNIGGADFKLT